MALKENSAAQIPTTESSSLFPQFLPFFSFTFFIQIVPVDSMSSGSQKEPSLSFSPEQFAQMTAFFQKARIENHPQHQVSHVNQISNVDQSYTHQQSSMNVPSGNLPWILDTGATDHVTHHLSYFITYKSIKPITVTLPNGNSTIATHLDTIAFSDDFYLHDVLFIPEFKQNLISIHKLITTLNCKLIFDHSSCTIQGMNSLKMIRHAKVKSNLYILDKPAKPLTYYLNIVYSVKCTNNVAIFDHWHFRLGHPSNTVLHTICQHFPHVQFDSNKVCDHYHFAKQSRLPFPISNSKTRDIFLFILHGHLGTT